MYYDEALFSGNSFWQNKSHIIAMYNRYMQGVPLDGVKCVKTSNNLVL